MPLSPREFFHELKVRLSEPVPHVAQGGPKTVPAPGHSHTLTLGNPLPHRPKSVLRQELLEGLVDAAKKRTGKTPKGAYLDRLKEKAHAQADDIHSSPPRVLLDLNVDYFGGPELVLSKRLESLAEEAEKSDWFISRENRGRGLSGWSGPFDFQPRRFTFSIRAHPHEFDAICDAFREVHGLSSRAKLKKSYS